MTTYKAILEILKEKGQFAARNHHHGCDHLFLRWAINQRCGRINRGKIAILSEDDSAIEKGFVDYLAKQHNLITLKDTSQKH